jgi:hypothetical protein
MVHCKLITVALTVTGVPPLLESCVPIVVDVTAAYFGSGALTHFCRATLFLQVT